MGINKILISIDSIFLKRVSGGYFCSSNCNNPVRANSKYASKYLNQFKNQVFAFSFYYSTLFIPISDFNLTGICW